MYDGAESSPLPLAGDGPGVRGTHVVLQFDKTGTGDAAAADLSHRYLWGPAVDQILADEEVDDLFTPRDVFWPLTDHLGTVRDLASYDAQTDTTTIPNHRTYDAFGRLTSKTAPAVDHLFAFTGRPFHETTGLQNNLNRWYDPTVARWLSEDPIAFTAGDVNLSCYVGNQPLDFTDWNGLQPQGKDTGRRKEPLVFKTMENFAVREVREQLVKELRIKGKIQSGNVEPDVKKARIALDIYLDKERNCGIRYKTLHVPMRIQIARSGWGAELTPEQIESVRYHEWVHLEAFRRPLKLVADAVKDIDKALVALPKDEQRRAAQFLKRALEFHVGEYLKRELAMEMARQDFHLDHLREHTLEVVDGKIRRTDVTYFLEFDGKKNRDKARRFLESTGRKLEEDPTARALIDAMNQRSQAYDKRFTDLIKGFVLKVQMLAESKLDHLADFPAHAAVAGALFHAADDIVPQLGPEGLLHLGYAG